MNTFLYDKYVCSIYTQPHKVCMLTRGCWTDWLVDEQLQAISPLLNEGLLKKALISTERQLSLQGFARQRWYYNLKVSGVNTQNRKDEKHATKIWNPHSLCCKIKSEDISINIYDLQSSNKLI